MLFEHNETFLVHATMDRPRLLQVMVRDKQIIEIKSLSYDGFNQLDSRTLQDHVHELLPFIGCGLSSVIFDHVRYNIMIV